MDRSSCFICNKHDIRDGAQGGILFEDDLLYVGHVHTMGRSSAYRGWLVVETKRHVARLGDLTDAEASAVGMTANRAARTLLGVAGAEHVYSFVYGDGVPHFHLHLAPRYPGTPRDFWGPRLREWPDSPQVDGVAMRRLVGELRDAFSDASPVTN